MPATDFLQQEYDLSQAQLAAEQARVEQDLASQLAGYEQNWANVQQQIGGQVGIMERDRPEQLGRLGSQFAAMGSFRSGARESAQGTLHQGIQDRIDALQREQAAKSSEIWRGKELAKVQAQRAQEDLTRQLEMSRVRYDQAREAERLARARGGRGRAPRFAPLSLQTAANMSEQARLRMLRSNPGVYGFGEVFFENYYASNPGATEQQAVDAFVNYFASEQGLSPSEALEGVLDQSPILSVALFYGSQAGQVKANARNQARSRESR